MVPCEVCGRTFFPDRIETHRKYCKGLSPAKSLSVLSLQNNDQDSAKIIKPVAAQKAPPQQLVILHKNPPEREVVAEDNFAAQIEGLSLRENIIQNSPAKSGQRSLSPEKDFTSSSPFKGHTISRSLGSSQVSVADLKAKIDHENRVLGENFKDKIIMDTAEKENLNSS